MRHLLTLRPHPKGVEAFDPHLPWLKPSVGRTPEEAVARFKERLRFVDVEKRQARSWWQAKATTARIFLALCWEIMRAGGLWLVGGGDRRVALIGVVILVGVPLALCVLALFGK